MIEIPQDKFIEILRRMDADDAVIAVNEWLARGDGAAVYENHELGHPELGHKKIVSFGSPAAQLEVDEPPTRLPDIGGTINWRYQLVGVYRGPVLIVEQGV